MSKRLFKLFSTAVLLLAALMPLVECFDRWDGAMTIPSNDTEFRLMIVFIGIGVLLTLLQLLRFVPVLFGAPGGVLLAKSFDLRWCRACTQWFEPVASPPPLPLRI